MSEEPLAYVTLVCGASDSLLLADGDNHSWAAGQQDLPTCASEGENLQGKPVHGYPDHDRMLGRFLGRA